MEFIDRAIVACAHGIGRAGMFVMTLWARVLFVVLCIIVIGLVTGLVAGIVIVALR
jgi:hypothetical protein